MEFIKKKKKTEIKIKTDHIAEAERKEKDL